MVLSLFAETSWATLNVTSTWWRHDVEKDLPMTRILFKGFLSQICSFDMKRFLTCLHNNKPSVFTPWPFRPKGYCRCLRPYVCPSVRPFVCLSVRKLYLVGTITRHRFCLNHEICTKHASWDTLGIENRGHWPWPSRSFWPFWLRILENFACPHDNSSLIWATITKFAPNMHSAILSAGIENGGHWLWPSRSFSPFWLRILGILACPPNNF